MKRRSLEYNYDWMQYSIFKIASRVFNGSAKEMRSVENLLPTFHPVVQLFLKQGEISRRFMLIVVDYLGKIISAHERGDKIALSSVLCNQLLLDAFDGLQPLCAESLTAFASVAFRQGNYEYFDYGCEKGLTETSCSAQRGLVGAVLAGLMSAGKPDLCILGSAGPCDTNCNSLQFYAGYAGIPLITLDTPSTLVDERAGDFQVRDMENMIEQIEKLTGARLNENRLRHLLNEKQKQNEMLGEIFDLMRLVPNPVPAVAVLFAATSNLVAGGSKLQSDLFEEILRVSQQNAREGKAGTYSGKEKARLFMCYIDHYTINAQFYEWVMANDITIYINMVTTLWWEGVNYSQGLEEECYRIDTSSRQSTLKTLAALNSRLAMNKQFRGPWDARGQWLSDCKAIAKIVKPDYIIYAGTLGCRNSWSVNKLLQREMEKLGYPFMITFADVVDERPKSWEQVKREMEEFMAVRKPGRSAA